MQNYFLNSYRGCNIDYGTLFAIRLYAYIIASICSFTGNLLVILIVYRNKNLRTSTNYFIVSMSVSDILFPLFELFYQLTFILNSRLSKVSGILICNFFPFIINVSYGVSLLTLVVITVYRFYAVMFPLRARAQNKRKRILVLILTWVIPTVGFSIHFASQKFDKQYQTCLFTITNILLLRILSYAYLSLYFFFPSLFMLVLYPLIILKLKRNRVPGNVNCFSQALIRRRKQNVQLTMMFLVITVAFLLSWGPFIIIYLLFVIKYQIPKCVSSVLVFVSNSIPVVFHAINPVIYFIFLSSFRQGFKNIFRSSFCNRTRPQAPANNFEMNNIPQALHNN